MASGGPDVTASEDPADPPADCPGKKKSKFQTFKNFFVRKKRKDAGAGTAEAALKASQSTDDVTAPEPTAAHSDAPHDAGPKVTMGNKALSHDSVFVSDAPSLEANEGLASSQDSIPGKVKSIQLQLKQAIRLGTPPGLTCMKKRHDTGALSEDEGLPCSPPESSSLHTAQTESSHGPPSTVQRTGSLSLEGSDSDNDQTSVETSSRPVSPPHYVPADFSCPATPSACLDSSAARHRIAVRQRACAKRKPVSRELLDSSKVKDLNGRFPEVAENQLNAVSPEPLPPEDKPKDSDMEEKDSVEMRGKEQEDITSEEQEVMTDEEKKVMAEDEKKVMAEEEKKVMAEEEEDEVVMADEEEEEVVMAEEQEEEVVIVEKKEEEVVMTEEEEEEVVMAEEEEEEEEDVMVEEEKEFMTDKEISDTVQLSLQSEEKINGKDQCQKNKAVEQSAVEEGSADQGIPSPSSFCLASSCESDIVYDNAFLPKCALDPQMTLGSMTLLARSEAYVESLESPTGDSDDLVTDLSCKTAVGEESGSLLQEVLSSLKQPLTSAFVLEPAAVGLRVETESAEADSAVTSQDDGMQLSPSEAIVTQADQTMAEGRIVISYSTEGEEECDEEECAQSEEGDKEGDKEAEILLIDEPVLAVECVKEEDVDLEENDVEEDRVLETQVKNYPVDQEMLELEAADEENTQTVDVLDSKEDSESTFDCCFGKRVHRSADDNQPEKESLCMKDSNEPDEPLDSPEKLNQEPTMSHLNANVNLLESQEDASAQESSNKRPVSTDQSKVRFTIAPAWQRSLSGSGLKEPHSPVTPEIFEASVDDPELLCAKAEQELAMKAETTPHPEESPIMMTKPLRKDPAPEEVDVAESPFGVKLRKTSLRSMCYSSEDPGETSWTFSRPEPSDQSKASCVEMANQKPALPRKPELLEDGVTKLKKAAEPTDSESHGGGLSSPTWISVARQKQKIFKENLLEENSLRKGPLEKDLPYNKSLSGLPRSTSKDQSRVSSPPPSGCPPTVLCSLEMSNVVAAEKEGRRYTTPPSPTGLGQEEPPWLALAKKKAKAWSEMPQIVQ